MNIVLEGIDGSGKSTQAARLMEKFGLKLWKFPNKNSPSGELIYKHLEGKWWVDAVQEIRSDGTGFDDLQRDEALIFQALQIANRLESASDLSREMQSKKNVLMDRYWPSGYAYGKADGLNGEYLINIHSYLPQPDIYILLDVDVKNSIERRPERRDRYEKNTGFIERVAQNYRDLWSIMFFKSKVNVPQEWIVVDARQDIETVAKTLNEHILALTMFDHKR